MRLIRWLVVAVLIHMPVVASAQVVLSRHVITSAAVQCSSSTYKMIGTLGGTIMRPAYPNPGFTMIQGFWSPTSEWTSDVATDLSEGWQFALRQNRPNPFKPTTTIYFVVANEGTVRTKLSVYDVTGRLVKTLVDASLTPGPQSVIWDGRDDSHRPVAAGVYFALLQSGKHQAKTQLVLLK